MAKAGLRFKDPEDYAGFSRIPYRRKGGIRRKQTFNQLLDEEFEDYEEGDAPDISVRVTND